MGIIYCAGSISGSGVTATIAGLKHQWEKAGKSVQLVKPFAVDPTSPDNGATLFNNEIQQHQIYKSKNQINTAKEQIIKLSRSADIILVEGLPVFESDEKLREVSRELAFEIGAKVIGVQHFSDTQPDQNFGDWRKIFGSTLGGVVVNKMIPNRTLFKSDALLKSAQESSVNLLAVIPEDRTLVSPTVMQIAEHVSAKWASGIPMADSLVENFLIGGLLMEWGGNYFGRFPKQGVIVRGGRIDIQMSALNFPMSCMLLTACSSPQQYVQQRAEAQGVPLMYVEESTMKVAELLDSVSTRVNVHHPEKIARFSELLFETDDIDALI